MRRKSRRAVFFHGRVLRREGDECQSISHQDGRTVRSTGGRRGEPRRSESHGLQFRLRPIRRIRLLPLLPQCLHR